MSLNSEEFWNLSYFCVEVGMSLQPGFVESRVTVAVDLVSN